MWILYVYIYIYYIILLHPIWVCLEMASIPPLEAIKHIREMTHFNHWIVLGGYLGTKILRHTQLLARSFPHPHASHAGSGGLSQVWLSETSNQIVQLVGGIAYPSEKYESQLGWWHSQYMEKWKPCSKPPTKQAIINWLAPVSIHAPKSCWWDNRCCDGGSTLTGPCNPHPPSCCVYPPVVPSPCTWGARYIQYSATRKTPTDKDPRQNFDFLQTSIFWGPQIYPPKFTYPNLPTQITGGKALNVGAPNLLHLRVVRWRNTIEVGCNLRAQILGSMDWSTQIVSMPQ